MHCKHHPVTIMQGDTFDLEVNIRNVIAQDVVVNAVHFDCQSLGLHIDMIEEANDDENCTDDYWYLSLNAEQTSELRIGHFTFDITADVENGEEIETIFHNEVLEVIFKPNK